MATIKSPPTPRAMDSRQKGKGTTTQHHLTNIKIMLIRSRTVMSLLSRTFTQTSIKIIATKVRNTMKLSLPTRRSPLNMIQNTVLIEITRPSTSINTNNMSPKSTPSKPSAVKSIFLNLISMITKSKTRPISDKIQIVDIISNRAGVRMREARQKIMNLKTSMTKIRNMRTGNKTMATIINIHSNLNQALTFSKKRVKNQIE